MTANLHLFGAHRGGRQFLSELPPSVTDVLGADWTVADPRAERASALAASIPNRFPGVRGHAAALPAQQAVRYAGVDDHLVLATDTLSSIQETLALRERRPATFQIVGRGPGGLAGARLGIQSTLHPADADTARQVDLLLQGLERLSEEGSSLVLTQDDPLLGATLAPLRARVTKVAAAHLLHRERDPWDLPSGPLSMVVQGRPAPTVVEEVTTRLPLVQQKELIRELSGRWEPVWARAQGEGVLPTANVVLVGPEGLSLFTVQQRRPGAEWRTAGVVRMEAPKVIEARFTPVVSPRVAARFTD